jgi:membrane associated rhomboid family serine protease
MIIPLGDDNRDRRSFPLVTYALIVINVVVFSVFQGFGRDVEFTYAYAAVPEEIVTGNDLVSPDAVYKDASGASYLVPGLQPTPVSVYLTLITSMFMHGGWAHLIGNMLYLFIFGDNVEDRTGKLRFVLFYVITGIVAAMAHVGATYLFGGDMRVPMIGASGAISGVLGAYLVLFPRKRVRVILIRILTSVPAWVAVGVWFAFQILNGLGALGGASGGVAYAAHVGGFVAGMGLIWLFLSRHRAQPQPGRRQ